MRRKPCQAVQKVPDHLEVGTDPQGHAAGIGREVWRKAERQCWQDRHAKRLRCLDGDTLREDGVRPQGQEAVLFGGADRQHDAVIVF